MGTPKINPHAPVLSPDGKVYCSPRCGFRCSRAEYDFAVKASAELAARMGKGWEPRVWENAGWHYEVRNGACTISAHHDRREGFNPERWGASVTYMAWINLSSPKNLCFIETAATPEDALGFATQSARTLVARLVQALDAIVNAD